MTPVIIADGAFSRDPVAERFRQGKRAYRSRLRAFVYETVKKYPPEKASPEEPRTRGRAYPVTVMSSSTSRPAA